MDYEKERREAIEAGNRALSSLKAARADLNSAGNWGIFDLLGGGFLTDVIKHSKMNNAQVNMERAKWELENFGKELSDIAGYITFDFNTMDFLSFADYFFDGLLADWLMQDRINKAKSQVDEAISRVTYILERL
ncbi:MAG: hypothetical protein K6G26_00740 [Lachnospiraceae bacterium]|nr:hypothetical protein [Lachnospiraceae bacterium]